jgi:hypothetical protein
MRLPRPVDLPEGVTRAKRLDMAFCKALTVSKAALMKDESPDKRQKERKRSRQETDLKPKPVVIAKPNILIFHICYFPEIEKCQHPIRRNAHALNAAAPFLTNPSARSTSVR